MRAVGLRQRCIHMHELPTAMKSPSSLESASPAGALLTCKTVKSIETRVNSIQNRIKLRAPFLKQQRRVGKKGGGDMPAIAAGQQRRQRVSGEA